MKTHKSDIEEIYYVPKGFSNENALTYLFPRASTIDLYSFKACDDCFITLNHVGRILANTCVYISFITVHLCF